jgi:predicted outer membrane protein
MSKRKLTRLQAAFDKRYAKWLESKEPDINAALEGEIEDGATPDEIEEFANNNSGDQKWFADRVIGAARHIERRQRQRA